MLVTKGLQAELAALRRMSPGELRQRYQEVFGEPSRSGNKEFLSKRIAWRVQSLAEGSLSERARARAAELARDADVRMTIPPARPCEAGGAVRIHAAPAALATIGHLTPPPGTVLTRDYKGAEVRVTVLPKGFEYEGQVYRSLSAVAKAVTGSHWNGRAFFGLTKGRES
jgi:Protein of unknown function (DUF2924)